jgi:phage N-6-adenine-methyltransferase
MSPEQTHSLAPEAHPAEAPILALTSPAELEPPVRQPHRGQAATDASRDDWHTPQSFLAGLRERWRFVLDAAAQVPNVAPEFLTKVDDGLTARWIPAAAPWGYTARLGQLPPAVWCNPPYGRRGEQVSAFVARAAEQARDVCGPAGMDVVALLGATPDRAWFHEAMRSCDEIWFVRKRIAFVNPDTGVAQAGNPNGSVVVVWRCGFRRPGGPYVGSLTREGRPPLGWTSLAAGGR